MGYSGGMRRRLDIAVSLVVTPGVLFLDERTTGLDPTARRKVWRPIRKLAGSGVTVLPTEQDLEEADHLIRRIAVVNHGRKIAEGTSRELKLQTGSGFLHVALADPAGLDRSQALPATRPYAKLSRNAEDSRVCVKVESSEAAAAALQAQVAAGGGDVLNLMEIRRGCRAAGR